MVKPKRVVNWLVKHLSSGSWPPELTKSYLRQLIMKEYYLKFSPFEKTVRGERYVYFPLHMQPESSTLLFGKYYCDQISVVENIAKNTPSTHMVYVKEHPSRLGHRPNWYHKKIASIPNVRLIHPRSDNLKIIEGSDLVITISGTAGYEALTYYKPVILLGSAFYSKCSEVIKLTAWDELPDLIKYWVDEKVNKYEINMFLKAHKESTYKGCVILGNPNTLQDANVKLLAKALTNQIKQIQEVQ